MKLLEPFSFDYVTARERFRDAVSSVGWSVESHSIGVSGPAGEDLSIDVGISQGEAKERALVVSSGLHGAESNLGSAIQLALLQRWKAGEVPPTKCVFIHALNPYGFAYGRRFDENNVDPNRSFRLPHDHLLGAPDLYAKLDPLLNPKRPPSRWDPFLVKAAWIVARYGMRRLSQAIAAGQYEFPQGLFYGGSEPSTLQSILELNFPRWLDGCRCAVHLDFHTGLGRSGEGKLLLETPLSDQQRAWLIESVGEEVLSECHESDAPYDARGGLGRWCHGIGLAQEYIYACAEFGTYPPVQVLSGLRAENQAHHWGSPDDASTLKAKKSLRELFCPASETWRKTVFNRGLEIVEQIHRRLRNYDLR